MRTIKGWTKEEQKELEWHKKNGNTVDDVIDTIYDPTSTCYLHDKYDYNSQNPERIIFDIVDFWRGDAKFPEKKYKVKILNDEESYLNMNLDNSNVFLDDEISGNGIRTLFTIQEIKAIDERLVPFAVEVKHENN